MHLILCYANGHRADALLLTMTRDAMRVVLHRSDETIEFHLVEGRWIGDDGSNVTIEAMLPAAAVRRAGNSGLTLAACSS